MTATLTAWGLDTLPRERWEEDAACLWDFRFTEGPYGSAADGHRAARELMHVCNAHCPVIAQCLEAAEESRPYGIVQAGQLWPDWTQKGPRKPPDIGCGRHCADRAPVHSGGVR